MTKFKVGDRVELSGSSEYFGQDTLSNPTGVEGFVSHITSGEHGLEITWNTGFTNNYNSEDLVLWDKGGDSGPKETTTTSEEKELLSDSTANTNSNKKVLLLNSPPNSGKDTAAKLIKEYLNNIGVDCYHKEFKEELIRLTKLIYGITDASWGEMYDRESKDLPHPYLTLNGVCISPRKALQHVSEDIIKPLLGNNYFGDKAAEGLQDGWNIFSDCGFPEEAESIIRHIGKDNVKCLKISSEGCEFTDDTRDWLDTDKLGIECGKVVNRKDIMGFSLELGEWLIKLGIK